ncbi:MAG: ABC transporter ATP-binding protein [Desulfobacterales bacterium]|nr:ABC transporter ATP-binding protein [Desulfobacterales bacterium]MBF0398540.1 ABC transporter ATP-binding protein [Desulfobacterales bacterium]
MQNDNYSFISLKGIYKTFKNNGVNVEILKELCFDINKGDTIAIVGASGIGKSTLLHILGTLDRPDIGTILFEEKDVFLFDDKKLAKFRNQFIGFVFQFHHLLPEFSTIENVMMPALIQGYNKKESKDMAESILVRVGLKERLYFRTNQLSGGEQQRTALARSLIMNPMVLLADEPTGNLDKRNSNQVHDLLMELNRELSMTMVVVTHNMELAGLMNHRVTIVDGQLLETS